MGGLELIEQGDKMDEDEYYKLQEELKKKRGDASDKIAHDEEDVKDKFARKVDGMEDGEDFRQKLLDEMNEKMGRIDGVLQNEEDAQMSTLEKKLLQRKQRRNRLVDKFGAVQDQKREKEAEGRIQFNKIENDMYKDIDDLENDLNMEEQMGKAEIQENINQIKRDKLSEYEDKLKRGKKGKDFQNLLDEYS